MFVLQNDDSYIDKWYAEEGSVLIMSSRRFAKLVLPESEKKKPTQLRGRPPRDATAGGKTGTAAAPGAAPGAEGLDTAAGEAVEGTGGSVEAGAGTTQQLQVLQQKQDVEEPNAIKALAKAEVSERFDKAWESVVVGSNLAYQCGQTRGIIRRLSCRSAV